MKVVLAEKPSVARDIAAFVGARSRKDGYFEGKGFQVTWAFGHLVTLKDPDEYDPEMKRWSLETLPFIPDDFLLKHSRPLPHTNFQRRTIGQLRRRALYHLLPGPVRCLGLAGVLTSQLPDASNK